MIGALTLAVFAVTGLGSERPIGEVRFVSGDVALTRPDARPVAGEARMPLQRGDLLETSAGWVRLDYVPGAAPDPFVVWLGPRSRLRFIAAQDGSPQLRLERGTLRARARESSRSAALALTTPPALRCRGEPGDVVLTHERNPGFTHDVVFPSVAAVVRDGSLECLPVKGAARRVTAGEILWVEASTNVYDPKPLAPGFWEGLVLQVAAPDDLEGAEWLGLGSDHERIERAFRYRYRDRDCKLLDIRVWTTDSRVQVTLGEVRLQCSDEAAQRKLLKQGHYGWGWLH
jgi:hypothetical protein